MYVQSQNGKHHVVSINHGRKWVNADKTTVFGDVTKTPVDTPWFQKGPMGDKVGPGNPEFGEMSRLDSWLLMFPP